MRLILWLTWELVQVPARFAWGFLVVGPLLLLRAVAREATGRRAKTWKPESSRGDLRGDPRVLWWVHYEGAMRAELLAHGLAVNRGNRRRQRGQIKRERGE